MDVFLIPVLTPHTTESPGERVRGERTSGELYFTCECLLARLLAWWGLLPSKISAGVYIYYEMLLHQGELLQQANLPPFV